MGLFSGSKTTTDTREYTGFNPNLYGYNQGQREGVGPDERGFQGFGYDLINRIGNSMPGGDQFWNSFGGGAGGDGGGPGGGGGYGDFSGGGGGYATADKIDMSDPTFSLEAPEPWMSGVLARTKEMANASGEESIRKMTDQGVRSGMSTSSPAFAYMTALMRRGETESAANASRDASLGWTLPAAGRRASALGQNSQMGTSVSELNAQLAEQAAGRYQKGQMFGADYGLRRGAANEDKFKTFWTMLQQGMAPNAALQYLMTKQTTKTPTGGIFGAIVGALGSDLLKSVFAPETLSPSKGGSAGEDGGGWDSGGGWDPNGWMGGGADSGGWDPEGWMGGG